MQKSNRVLTGKTYEEIYGIERANEIKTKLKESHKGQLHSFEQKAKVSKALKGHPYWGNKERTIESRLKTSNSLKGRKLSAESKLKIGLANKISIKKLWQNSTYRIQQVKHISNGWKKLPTKPELYIITLIKQHQLPFEYNGYNGNVVIGGKIPDFVSTDGSKKIIEVFGRLFHDPKFPRHLSAISESKTFDGTVRHYQKYGYKCLILWDDQILDSLPLITAFNTEAIVW